MFCPKCKAEYREGFSRCAKCDIDLVPELPSEQERSENDVKYMDLVKIKSYSNRHEAELEKGFLSSNGIFAVVSGDDCGGVRPALSFIRGIHLMVKKEDVENAGKILVGDNYSTIEKEGLDSIKKPVTSFLSKAFTWSFIISLGSFVGAVIVWAAFPEYNVIKYLETVLLILWIAAKMAWCITIGIIAHRLGRQWVIWIGFSVVIGPIGFIIAYLVMLGHIKKARYSKQLTGAKPS